MGPDGSGTDTFGILCSRPYKREEALVHNEVLLLNARVVTALRTINSILMTWWEVVKNLYFDHQRDVMPRRLYLTIAFGVGEGGGSIKEIVGFRASFLLLIYGETTRVGSQVKRFMGIFAVIDIQL